AGDVEQHAAEASDGALAGGDRELDREQRARLPVVAGPAERFLVDVGTTAREYGAVLFLDAASHLGGMNLGGPAAVHVLVAHAESFLEVAVHLDVAPVEIAQEHHDRSVGEDGVEVLPVAVTLRLGDLALLEFADEFAVLLAQLSVQLRGLVLQPEALGDHPVEAV